jgi:hypothetical protein
MSVNDSRVCARFTNSQSLIQPFHEKGGGSSFVADWYHRYSHKSSSEKIQLAALGIEHEGRLIDKADEAQYLATELREVANSSWETIMTKCIELYTRECFLYRLINQTLRENNLSKVETLGPFCWFLQNASFCEFFASKCYTGCVYRGAQLDDNSIENYRQAIGTVKAWRGFSSTSKNPLVARMFGQNTLFIIETNTESTRQDHGIDISTCSQFPMEEEVLIRAGHNF